jgi:hypothetical protein
MKRNLYVTRRTNNAADHFALLKKVRPCPFGCKLMSFEILYKEGLECYQVVCHTCGAQGPEGMSERIAVLKWNRRKIIICK